MRSWSDGCVVFDDANSQLQCLSPVFGELMTLVLQRPMWTPAELALEFIGETPTFDEVEMIENALKEFSSLNIIERISV